MQVTAHHGPLRGHRDLRRLRGNQFVGRTFSHFRRDRPELPTPTGDEREVEFVDSVSGEIGETEVPLSALIGEAKSALSRKADVISLVAVEAADGDIGIDAPLPFHEGLQSAKPEYGRWVNGFPANPVRASPVPVAGGAAQRYRRCGWWRYGGVRWPRSTTTGVRRSGWNRRVRGRNRWWRSWRIRWSRRNRDRRSWRIRGWWLGRVCRRRNRSVRRRRWGCRRNCCRRDRSVQACLREQIAIRDRRVRGWGNRRRGVLVTEPMVPAGMLATHF